MTATRTPTPNPSTAPPIHLGIDALEAIEAHAMELAARLRTLAGRARERAATSPRVRIDVPDSVREALEDEGAAIGLTFAAQLLDAFTKQLPALVRVAEGEAPARRDGAAPADHPTQQAGSRA